MLEAVGITKQFSQQKAVDSVHIYLGKGEIVGLLGPNGAGKSTTISIISSLIQPTKGEVYFKRQDVLKQPKVLRERLGLIPQEIALYEELTARENLNFFGKIQRMDRAFLKEKVEEVLELIGLEDQGKKLVKHYSGGMKRRLNIGVALLHEPELLMMDEPTVGIDPQSRTYILETVKRLNREKQMTILYTSHYMEEVEFLCDRMYIMDRGSVIASGTKDEIKHILSAEQTIQVKLDRYHKDFHEKLKQEPIITRIDVQDQWITLVVPKDVQLMQTIFNLAEQTGAVILSMDIKTPTLEDVFLHLTGRTLRN